MCVCAIWGCARQRKLQVPRPSEVADFQRWRSIPERNADISNVFKFFWLLDSQAASIKECWKWALHETCWTPCSLRSIFLQWATPVQSTLPVNQPPGWTDVAKATFQASRPLIWRQAININVERHDAVKRAAMLFIRCYTISKDFLGCVMTWWR